MSSLTIEFFASYCEGCQKFLISSSAEYTQKLSEDHDSQNEEHQKVVNQQSHNQQHQFIKYKLIDLMDLCKQNYILDEFSDTSVILDFKKNIPIQKLRLKSREEDNSSKRKEIVIFLDCYGSLEELLSLILILQYLDYSFQGDTISGVYFVTCSGIRNKLLTECQEYQIDDITIKSNIDMMDPSEPFIDFDWRIGDEEYKKVTNSKYIPQRSKFFELKKIN